MEVCKERRGERLRRVEEVVIDDGLLTYLEHQCHNLPKDIRDFSALRMPGSRVFLVDGVGAIIKGPLLLENMPDMHCVFWDRILAGRETMCYNVARQIAADEGRPGVWTAIPLEYRQALAFARRIGFHLMTFTTRRSLAVLTLLFTSCK